MLERECAEHAAALAREAAGPRGPPGSVRVQGRRSSLVIATASGLEPDPGQVGGRGGESHSLRGGVGCSRGQGRAKGSKKARLGLGL
jgi:hypothetical protein